MQKGLQLYQKLDYYTGVFLWVLQIFKNTFFTEHLRAAAADHSFFKGTLMQIWKSP